MKYILKDLKNNPIFSLFFIINIAVGLWGISVIEIFQHNLQSELQKTAKASSGADIMISSRKFLSDNQLSEIKKILPEGSDFDETRSMYSMLGSDGESILVNVKAVGAKFPFYGEIELQSGRFINSSIKNQLYKSPDIIVSEDVLIQLDKSVGSEISLGNKKFTIRDVIKKDLGMSWSGASLAPSVYIGYPFLKDTGLLDTGSTYFKNYLIKLPDGSDESSFVSSIKTMVEDPGINIKSYRDSGQLSSRIFSYITDYLGIVSLCALFLSCAGVYYLIKAFFEKKYKDIAIYLSIGMNRSSIIRLYIFQILILAVLGSVLNMVLGLISIPIITDILSKFTALDLEISIDYTVFLKVLMISLSVCFLLSLPEILYIKKVKASSLFSEDQLDMSKTINLRLLPAVCLLFFLSIWISNSFKIGSIFFISLIIGSLIIVSLSFSFIKILEPMSQLNYKVKQAFRYILHHKAESALYILCIGVSACLLNLIPQIQNSLNKELDLNSHKDRPSLFVFDIQDYQLDDLRAVLKKENYELENTSPLVRGRIVSINGKEFTRDDKKYFSREDQGAKAIKNRSLNLSYRKKLSESETIIEGEFPKEKYDLDSGKDIEISLEFRYARRLGVGIGDKLSIEIQGLDFETVVTSIRKIKWTSFQPNFFIQFQDGAINDAPKIYISSMKLDSEEERRKVQNIIVKNFSNISSVDISKVLAEVLKLMEKMSYILMIMVLLVSVSGVLVVIAINYQQFLSRRTDIKLLKLIGTPIKTIIMIPLIESILLSVSANILGVGVGLMSSFILAKYVFDGAWSINYSAMLYIFIAIPFICASISIFLAFIEGRRKYKELEL